MAWMLTFFRLTDHDENNKNAWLSFVYLYNIWPALSFLLLLLFLLLLQYHMCKSFSIFVGKAKFIQFRNFSHQISSSPSQPITKLLIEKVRNLPDKTFLLCWTLLHKEIQQQTFLLPWHRVLIKPIKRCKQRETLDDSHQYLLPEVVRTDCKARP